MKTGKQPPYTWEASESDCEESEGSDEAFKANVSGSDVPLEIRQEQLQSLRVSQQQRYKVLQALLTFRAEHGTLSCCSLPPDVLVGTDSGNSAASQQTVGMLRPLICQALLQIGSCSGYRGAFEGCLDAECTWQRPGVAPASQQQVLRAYHPYKAA